MTLSLEVRSPKENISILDITGDITGQSEAELMAGYDKAATDKTRNVVLNFTKLQYMNSSGIGLLVTLLVRANRSKQKLMAYGLTEHYRSIFELTRLDEAVSIHDTEDDALAAAK